VLAGAFASTLAVTALIAGKYLGWWWLDPMMCFVGAAVILNWSWSLIRRSGAMLIDKSDSQEP
jgi:Co/Zn/Cd efflux system component